MSDLISREYLYEKTAKWESQALHEVEKYHPKEDRDKWLWWSAVLKERTAFKYDVVDAPSVNIWIPCKERLPSNNREVLISCGWGIDIGYYEKDGWHSEWINHYDDDKVLAWIPLPEPWKDGDNGD
jgi:hypothetical protein